MKKEDLWLYLAGGLFNAGERLHNLYLEKHLTFLGYRVILPQRVALKFFSNGVFNIDAIVKDCQATCTRKDVIYVGCSDGADTDSGAAVEYGMAIAVTGRAVVYRTDFRTALEKEVGVNAMLRAKGTKFIYEPCFFTDLDKVDDFYIKLALTISHEVRKL